MYMNHLEHLQHISRRHFLMESAAGLGAAAQHSQSLEAWLAHQEKETDLEW